MVLKRILVIVGLLLIVILDVYLAGTFLFSSKNEEKKEIITIPSDQKPEPKKEKNTQKIKVEPEEKEPEKEIKSDIKKIKNKNAVKNLHKKVKKMSSKEIDQLIEKIIEEARQEYHYSKEKKEKKSILDRIFRFGD